MANFFINLIVFIVSLAILVVIHEFGHFIFAKAFKVYVTEFSIGFGPALYTKKKDGKETRFSIRAIPLGGYCSMVGEALPEFTEEEYQNLSDKDKELVTIYKTVPESRRLDKIAKWKRAIIMVAGVTLNFLLGFFLLFIFFTTNSFATMYDNVVVVDSNSIAEKAGWKSEDVITSVSYVIHIEGQEELTKEAECADNTGNLYSLVLDLGKNTPKSDKDIATYTLLTQENKEIIVELKAMPTEEVGTYSWPKIGISFSPNMKTHLYRYTFGEAVVETGSTFGEYSVAIFKGIGTLFTKEGFQQASGIVGIFSVQQQMMNMGFTYVINLWALISINLGIMNLLPFPGLDGWHLLVVIVEGITRKELPKKFKSVMSTIGMVLLFGLMIVITFKDIFSLF